MFHQIKLRTLRRPSEISPVSLVTQGRFEGQTKFWFERVLDDY